MNTENLMIALDYIKQEPLRLDMKTYVIFDLPPDAGYPPCRTACCLAGAICLVKGVSGDSSPETFKNKAIEFFDLTHPQAQRLFHVSKWPEEYKYAYNLLEYPETDSPAVFAFIAELRFQILRNRVYYFIYTHGHDTYEYEQPQPAAAGGEEN